MGQAREVKFCFVSQKRYRTIRISNAEQIVGDAFVYNVRSYTSAKVLGTATSYRRSWLCYWGVNFVRGDLQHRR